MVSMRSNNTFFTKSMDNKAVHMPLNFLGTNPISQTHRKSKGTAQKLPSVVLLLFGNIISTRVVLTWWTRKKSYTNLIIDPSTSTIYVLSMTWLILPWSMLRSYTTKCAILVTSWTKKIIDQPLLKHWSAVIVVESGNGIQRKKLKTWCKSKDTQQWFNTTFHIPWKK